jgi:RNA polymerase primary sigma factor
MKISKLAADDNFNQIIALETNPLELDSVDFGERTDEDLTEPLPEPLKTTAAGSGTGYDKGSNEDTVGAFFKEMARYPLLSAEEEIELAHSVKFLMEAEEVRQNCKKIYIVPRRNRNGRSLYN